MKLLFLAVFIDLLGFGIILPSLPRLAEELAGNLGEGVVFGWIIAIYSITQFMFSPLWGRLSDRIGRRPVIIFGLFGSFIAFTAFGFSKSFFWILFSRGLAGFFTAASLPTARAYIADITPRKERAAKFGLLGAAFGLGFTFGPVIGGLLGYISIGNLWNHAAPSFFAAILCLFNSFYAYKSLPESLSDEVKAKNQTLEKNSMLTKLQLAMQFEGIPALLLLFGLTTLVFAGFESIFSLLALYLDGSISDAGIGAIFGFIGLVVIFVQVGMIKPTVKKYGDENTAKIGLVILAVGFIALAYVNSILLLVLACIPMAIGSGLLNPSLTSSISNRIPADEQGGILGLNSSISALGRIFGPLIAGYLFDINVSYPFLLGFGVILISIAFAISMVQTWQEDDKTAIPT